MNYRRQLNLLLLPYAIGIVLLVIIPALLAFGMAFFEYNGLTAPRFVGGLNFLLVYTNELFNLSVINSLALVVLPAPLRLLGAYGMALLLWRGGRFLAFFRSLVFIPNIVPPAAYALAWLWILNPLFGPLNLTLRAAGIDAPHWLIEPEWAKVGLALASLWQIGEGFLVSLAALSDIPREVEDAARVDGANTRQLLTEIVTPMLSPILLILVLRDAILLLQESFTPVFLMTQGDPYYATYTLPYFIYEQGIGLLSFGTASAAIWVLYALSGMVVVALYFIGTQWGVATTEETLVL